MQAASDIFLGWLRLEGLDSQPRDYYVRQLHDWKGSVEVDTLRVPGATLYARLCGATLARAHARLGDRVAIAAYLGGGRLVRPRDRRLLGRLRRPERARLRGLREGGQVGASRRGDRPLKGRVTGDRIRFGSRADSPARRRPAGALARGGACDVQVAKKLLNLRQTASSLSRRGPVGSPRMLGRCQSADRS